MRGYCLKSFPPPLSSPPALTSPGRFLQLRICVLRALELQIHPLVEDLVGKSYNANSGRRNRYRFMTTNAWSSSEQIEHQNSTSLFLNRLERSCESRCALPTSRLRCQLEARRVFFLVLQGAAGQIQLRDQRVVKKASWSQPIQDSSFRKKKVDDGVACVLSDAR